VSRPRRVIAQGGAALFADSAHDPTAIALGLA
jgi:hypothetical protein